MKLIRLTESDLHRIVKESIKVILEGASKKLYHYCGVKQLKKMMRTDKFFFNDFEKDYSDGYYHFSTTRQRNSKMGFPAMARHHGGGIKNTIDSSFLIRLELDGEAVQNLQYDYRNKHYGVKVKPFDFIWHEFEGERPTRINGKGFESEALADGEDFAQEQHYSQAEDRIYSKKKSVSGFKKCLVRIDAFFDLDEIEGHEIEYAIEDVFYLRNLQEDGFDVHFYTNQDAFNIQANKTETPENILSRLREIEYLNG